MYLTEQLHWHLPWRETLTKFGEAVLARMKPMWAALVVIGTVAAVAFSAGIATTGLADVPSRVSILEDTFRVNTVDHIRFNRYIAADSTGMVAIRCMLEWLVDQDETAYNPLRCRATGYWRTR